MHTSSLSRQLLSSESGSLVFTPKINDTPSLDFSIQAKRRVLTAMKPMNAATICSAIN